MDADDQTHHSRQTPPDTPDANQHDVERAKLLAQVADWARTNAAVVGDGKSAVVHAPAGCSLATGFGLLAEGAQLLADLGQTRATPLALNETDYWFDVRNFRLADTDTR